MASRSHPWSCGVCRFFITNVRHHKKGVKQIIFKKQTWPFFLKSDNKSDAYKYAISGVSVASMVPLFYRKRSPPQKGVKQIIKKKQTWPFFFSNWATNRMPLVRNKWRLGRIPGPAAYAAFLSQTFVTTNRHGP